MREGPERVRDLIALGVALRPRGDAARTATYDLGREGGHSQRRILHARDATGREIERALAEARARARRTSQLLENHLAVDLLRRPARHAAPTAAGAPTCSIARTRRGRSRFRARATLLAHRRRRQGLPLHVQPRRRDRRRHRDGLPRGRADREHGVLPVPPDLPLPPAGQVVPDHRGAARRGRHPAPPRRRRLHGALPPDARSSRRATSSRARSTTR